VGLDQTLGTRLAAAVNNAGTATVRTFVEQDRGDTPRTLALSVGPAGRNKRFVLLEDFSGITSADRRRRDFVANASHELQTPIAAVMGMLELLEGAEGEYQRDLLRRSQKRIGDLSVLTKDLMGLARADDPSWSPPTHPVQIARLCEAVVERHEQEAAGKGLTLELLVEQEVEVIGGATSIETCVSNLVQNAISYTDEGGVILRVEACSGDGVAVTVEDTGCGIPPNLMPRIFERFFRVDPARSREAGGSGLGLAIVRNLAGSMGGRIAVSSQPGEGSRFRLELPSDPTRPLEGSGVVLHG
jgi:two-component system sensor histidine kinase SenX3